MSDIHYYVQEESSNYDISDELHFIGSFGRCLEEANKHALLDEYSEMWNIGVYKFDESDNSHTTLVKFYPSSLPVDSIPDDAYKVYTGADYVWIQNSLTQEEQDSL